MATKTLQLRPAEGVDGVFEFFGRAMYIEPELVLGEQGEPQFDEIDA